MYQHANLWFNMLPIGTKIKFAEEKQAYTIRASNRFYCVCTKPFNPRKTVLYSVIDLVNDIRGTENLVFGLGSETDEECRNMLSRLTFAELDISRRNYISLNIEKIVLPSRKILSNKKNEGINIVKADGYRKPKKESQILGLEGIR